MSSASDRMTSWVRSYGIRKLARQLGTDRRTVHAWTNGVVENRQVPSVHFVREMIRESQRNPLLVGPLTYEDFFGVVTV